MPFLVAGDTLRIDTLRLLVPDYSDSMAVILRESGGVGAFGVVNHSSNHVSGSLNYASGAGFAIDLVRLGTRLVGTLEYIDGSDTAKQVSFARYVPTGPNLAGTWITSNVVGGSSGTVFLDTLIINSDGRVQLASWFSASGTTICSVSGLRGVYRFQDGRLILGYAWFSQYQSPCPQLRLVDTLTVEENALIRARHINTGDLIETLTRQ